MVRLFSAGTVLALPLVIGVSCAARVGVSGKANTSEGTSFETDQAFEAKGAADAGSVEPVAMASADAGVSDGSSLSNGEAGVVSRALVSRAPWVEGCPLRCVALGPTPGALSEEERSKAESALSPAVNALSACMDGGRSRHKSVALHARFSGVGELIEVMADGDDLEPALRDCVSRGLDQKPSELRLSGPLVVRCKVECGKKRR